MKRLRTIGGTVVAVLLMAAVLYFYGGDLGTVRFTSRAAVSKLAAAVSLYVVVILFGSAGWRILLGALGNPLPRWSAERQVLIPQIGKYIPGNFAHYLGRAAMTAQAGVPRKTIGIALAAEVGATIAGGLLAIVISLAIAPELSSSIRSALPRAQGFSSAALMTTALAALGCLAAVVLLLRKVKHMPRVRLSGVFKAVLLYSLSFLLLGLSLRLVAGSLSQEPLPLSLSVAVFAAAWIAGLVTPGAPGGLGVRESAITLGLAPILGGSTGLAVALLHRGVSVLGDVISFGVGLLLPKIDASAA